MNGFIMAGKAFCVVEELRQFAEEHKGMTVSEVLKKRKLEEAEAKQFGISVVEFRKIIKYT